MEHQYKIKVEPTLVCRGSRIYKIKHMLDSYIVKRFTVSTNKSNIITDVYLHDCVHPNSYEYPKKNGESRQIEMTSELLKIPVGVLKFCLPPWFTLGNFKHCQENILKLIDVIEIWNLDDTYWAGYIDIDLESHNNLIEEFKTRYKFIGDSPIDLSSFEIV